MAGKPERASDRVDDPRPGAAIRKLIADVGQMENSDGLQIDNIEQPGGTGEVNHRADDIATEIGTRTKEAEL
ncbi:hypothetical protein Nepgr_026596 [Nepenthes gracilis]|uniref:Uncharacterized protein n=1 Tax=Nepenthes gracilis TaxID=150966 RepID=A0AAD3T7I0_NEPGR|nr:hypothetical protein Nepgr_026596 [Nepenthes gracilis]